MGTRKINFQRFKEGDNFNNGDTFNRFEQFETDLNEDQNGLHNTGISEGAINYQHLTHSGPLTTTEFSDAPINYGSTILKAECVRNPLTTDPIGHRVFNPFTDANLDTSGATFPGHLLLREKGRVIGSGDAGALDPQNMFITERWKMGTDYKGDADYVPAILLLFNTFITKGCDRIAPSGYTISLWFHCQNSTRPDAGYPILGTDRYGYQSPDTVGCGKYDPMSTPLGDNNDLKDCMPVSIRALISAQRLAANTDNVYRSDGTTLANLIVTNIQARVGILGKASVGHDKEENSILFRESSFTALALRGAWAK